MKESTFVYYLDRNSLFRKIGFFPKLLFIFLLSFFALYNENYIINFFLSLILAFFIFYLGFPAYNKKPFIAIAISSLAITLFWLLFSKVDGNVLYYTLPWSTFITEKTLLALSIALSKWILIVLTGMIFMISTNESDIIAFLDGLKMNKNIIIGTTVAFNTIGFTLRDLNKINMALRLRGFTSKNLFDKLRQLLYLGTSLVIMNLKKIEGLNQSYLMRSERSSNLVHSLQLKTKKFYVEDQSILSHLNLTIKSGDPFLIYGPSGSGKTSICKLISGIIPNVQRERFEGTIKFNNSLVSFKEQNECIGFAFQDVDDQFMLDNLEREIFFFLDENESKTAKQYLDLFGLNSLIEKSLKDLSSGQRKLISLISVVAQNKPILILDEPTANLDKTNSLKFVKLLKKISKRKIVIVASHDDAFLKLCNQFLYYNSGWKFTVNRKIVSSRKLFVKPQKKKQAVEVLTQVSNFSLTYPDGTRAVNSLSFRIHKHSITTFVGANGAGKTTVLTQIVTKLLKPKKLRIAFVMQEPDKQLFCTTVLDEICFCKSASLISISDLRKIHLSKHKNQHPLFLSRGQKQKLLIASSILQNPDLLIIDEPFTGLDKNSIEDIKEMLIDFKLNQNGTVILSAQETTQVKDIVDEVISIGV
jgi:energy-coupling factor transporter ATP-binding protein EcfA2/energy-coupling factor transporter transmembrane protein EcfT